MNKQELIRKYKELWKEHSPFHEPVPYTSMVELFLKELKQLDEPEKVVVQQFVADWYEDVVDEFYIVLERLVLNYRNNTNMPICKWFLETEDALKILINMHQFGYEVEKEKRYYVRFKGMESDDFNYLNFIKFQKAWVLSSLKVDKKFRTAHTRKELEEANFGWVFDCEGIKIEEVK